MGYEVVVIDATFNDHYGRVTEHIKHHPLGAKFEHPHIEKAWVDRVGQHKWVYWVHVKTGHLGNHHHFTVVYEIHFHHHHHHQVEKVHLIDIHEGHKTFF